MTVLALVLAALAGLLHLMIFVFESLWWTRETIWRRFGVASQADADTTKPMAFNQGFYNLFLAGDLYRGRSLLHRSSVGRDDPVDLLLRVHRGRRRCPPHRR